MKERITKSNCKNPTNKNNKGKKGRRNVDTDQHPTRNDRSLHNYGDVNDANYYFLDDTLKSQITNVSFNQYVGVPFDVWEDTNGKGFEAETPTMLTIALNPAAGTGNDKGTITGINLAALGSYTKLSANNAKTTQYGPQDITMLFLALGQVIALSSHIARVFGATKLYNARNRSYPKRVVEALGINYDNLIKNYADLRAEYNSLMTVLSSIPIPNNIAYFKKCSEIYSYIYLDMEGSSMAQTYAFVPFSTWQIAEEASTQGTKLNTVSVHSYGDPYIGMGTVLTILRNMVEALLSSSTLNYIYSDILRLVDKEGLELYKFTVLPDDYVVIPVYNPEIRKWINNCFLASAPKQTVDEGYTPNNDVLADVTTNTIKYCPMFQPGYTGTVKPIMNFDTGFPSIDDIVDATRLTAAMTVLPSGKGSALALPDYYPVNMKISYSKHQVKFSSSVLKTTDADFADKVAALSSFDWAPFLYPADSNGVITDYIGDVNFFTTLHPDYLMTLFDMGYQALLSMR